MISRPGCIGKGLAIKPQVKTCVHGLKARRRGLVTVGFAGEVCFAIGPGKQCGVADLHVDHINVVQSHDGTGAVIARNILYPGQAGCDRCAIPQRQGDEVSDGHFIDTVVDVIKAMRQQPAHTIDDGVRCSASDELADVFKPGHTID